MLFGTRIVITARLLGSKQSIVKRADALDPLYSQKGGGGNVVDLHPGGVSPAEANDARSEALFESLQVEARNEAEEGGQQ